MEKNNKWRQTKNTQNIKGKLLSNQIATRTTKEKKAGQAELARKLNANVGTTNVCVLFAAYRTRVQGKHAMD